MKASKLLIIAALVGTTIATSATGASAATARASNTINIYDGPGDRYDIIGRLPQSTVVTLDRCTYGSRWCLIKTGAPRGWVLGSYLIGSAAKLDASPPQLLVNPHLFFHRPPKM